MTGLERAACCVLRAACALPGPGAVGRRTQDLRPWRARWWGGTL